MKYKLLKATAAFLLALLMLLSVSCAPPAADAKKTTEAPAVTEAPSKTTNTPITTADTPSTTTTEPSATTTEPSTEPSTPSEDGIIILYTNDVHAYLDKEISYEQLAQLKKDLGENVLLVDAGDHIQGSVYGAMDEGRSVLGIMNEIYDLATLGNHEFDYGIARTLELTENSAYPYISCNFVHKATGETVLAPHAMKTVGDVKIGFVGITTPETITNTAPSYFQNDAGEFIYDFLSGEALYSAVQASIDELRAEGADHVIALGHVGVDPSSETTSRKIIENVTGLTAFIDGHSHTELAREDVSDKDGSNVVLTQTGTAFGAVGKMTLGEGGIKTELVKAYSKRDPSVEALKNSWVAEVERMLGEKIGTLGADLIINDEDGKRIVRVGSANSGDFIADSYYYYINFIEEIGCDLAIINGGGIRSEIRAGDISYKDLKSANPFGNMLCVVELTGQEILDMLEWGARSTAGTAGENENGAFLHTAGLKYMVDASIASTVGESVQGAWTGAPTGEYRVKDVKIYDKTLGGYKDIDLDAEYLVAGSNFTLVDRGDGFEMINGRTVKDNIVEDYMALAAYAKAFFDTNNDGLADIASANSPLCVYSGYGMNYEAPRGEERALVISARAIPLYCFDTKSVGDIELDYIGARADIPYIELSELVELYEYIIPLLWEDEDFSFTLSEEQDGVFTLTRENGIELTVDCEANTISADDYNAFFAYSYSYDRMDILGMNWSGGEDNYIKAHPSEYSAAGDPVTISLDDYGIELYSMDGSGYIPLQTLSDVFLANHRMCMLYNGEISVLGAGALDPEMEEQYYSVKKGQRSSELARFTYNELCLALDIHYGLREQYGIEDFDSYFKELGLYEKLTGKDPVAFNKALSTLTLGYIGDGHSTFHTSSPYAGSISVTPEFYGDSIQQMLADTYAYQSARAARYPDGAAGYEEIGNTAYITFDVFDLAFGDFYSDPPTEADAGDVIGLVAYAHSRIYREGSPIENVVLDLSCNQGGAVDAAVYVIAWFLGEAEIHIEDSYTGAKSTLKMTADVDLDHVAGETDDYLHDKNLYCIISPTSFSCGNLVPSAFRESGRVTLLGQTSGGGTCIVQQLTTADGGALQISGREIMSTVTGGEFADIEQGIAPDIAINDISIFYNRELITNYINSTN